MHDVALNKLEELSTWNASGLATKATTDLRCIPAGSSPDAKAAATIQIAFSLTISATGAEIGLSHLQNRRPITGDSRNKHQAIEDASRRSFCNNGNIATSFLLCIIM
jgi:hypothetical protein